MRPGPWGSGSLGRRAPSQLTKCSFKPETVTISPVQNIQIRKVFQEAGVNCQPGQETEQAPALLRTLGELAAWLKETERRIRDKLADGPVVV